MNGKNEHNIADIIWNLEKENEELKAEIKKAQNFIESKEKDKVNAESLFKK